MRRVLLTYAALGAVLWPVPLLNILHVEASAVVAFVAFFAAGWAALDAFNRRPPQTLRHVLWIQEAALMVPLALLTLSLLWVPNCDYLRGLLFFGLFPGLTVVFAVSGAYALSGTGWRFQKTILGGLGVGIALVGLLYDLGFHPQFYTYNHVFGGILGPIYDEELAVRKGIFTFRGLTLLWALWLYVIGRLFRARGVREKGAGPNRTADRAWRIEDRRGARGRYSIFNPRFSMFDDARVQGYRVSLLALTLLIGGCYAFSARLGFNTPSWYLQEQLGGHLRTTHFDLYYDPSSLEEHELGALAADHEYRYAWLVDRLALDEGPKRIASYLYPNPVTKARLTGARATSVAPVWLPRPQTHVLLDRYASTFGHELAHAFSRQFGLPVVNASWAIGLVEGLAVALEPPSGRPTPREQVSAVLLRNSDVSAETQAARVASRLQPLGFWTGRGAVSYTTMGSFVEFLLDRYGPGRLRAVYARADFEAVYGRSLEALTREWTGYLYAPDVVARDAAALVTRRFARPSLFERRCPHYVPPYRRAFREGRAALAAGDTVRARIRFAEALRKQPHFVEGHRALARLRLAHGEAAAVVRQLDTLAQRWRTPALALLLADARALQHRPAAARAAYEAVFDGLPHYAHESTALVALRRAVAGHPDVIRTLVSADSARLQAARLAALPDLPPPGRAWAALRYMEAGQFEEAAAQWRTVPPAIVADRSVFYRGVLRRQKMVWQAQTALRRGAPVAAQRYAEAAAEAFRTVGAFNLAAAADDLVQKGQWARRHRARVNVRTFRTAGP